MSKDLKPADAIEQALWSAGREPDPFAGGPAWQAGVMASVHRIGPLPAAGPRPALAPARLWPWATAIAACLVIGAVWIAFSDVGEDMLVAGALDDAPGLALNTFLVGL
jgi:hypothetical protein